MLNMSHTHVGGKKAIKNRLKRTEHRAVVLERKRRVSKAKILEMIKRHPRRLFGWMHGDCFATIRLNRLSLLSIVE